MAYCRISMRRGRIHNLLLPAVLIFVLGSSNCAEVPTGGGYDASGALQSVLGPSIAQPILKTADNLTREDEAYISALAANATRLQKEMLDSGLTESLLRSRLEAELIQERAPPAATVEGDAGVVCPPPGFNSLAKFSVKDYVSASWYVQKQQAVSYQAPDTLYCVKATYIPVDPKNLNAGLVVYNFANTGGVNMNPRGAVGAGANTQFFQLRARIPNPSVPSKLAVGPYFSGPLVNLTLSLLGLSDLPGFLSGPYWVVAAGPKTFGDPGFNGYKWAIISGGPPTTPSNGACKTGKNLPYQLQGIGVGYWFFTRDKVASPATIKEMEDVGRRLGFDNSVLLPVTQQGCTYEGSKDVETPVG